VEESVMLEAVSTWLNALDITLGAPTEPRNTLLKEIANSAVPFLDCVGLKLTLIVQTALGAREPVQALLCTYSEGLAPVSVIVGTLSEVVLTLVIVTVCALLVVPVRWLPNERLVGLTLSPAPASTVVVALGLPPGPVQVSV
jgi:hypothetical protein